MQSEDMKMRAVKTSVRPFTLKLMAASLLVLSLAACRGEDEGRIVGYAEPYEYEKRHPINVTTDQTELDIVVSGRTKGLNSIQRAQVDEFLGQWRHEGTGKITIAAPSGSANEGAAYQAAAEIRDLARDKGIPGHAVMFTAYSAGGGKPPVKISFLRYVAEGPTCGDWSRNLAEDPQNVAYPDYGCSSQHNLAAMIANPRDLIEMRDGTSRPGERRDEVWRKYVKGESTISQTSSEEKAGIISDVAKN
ncbi:MAG: CpaD family pilus assembly protein [Hyphomicrobiaceae bacterium]